MNNSEDLDLSTLIQMLREMEDMAENASLTGALDGGAKRLAGHYNNILAILREKNVPQAQIFSPIDVETADFGGIAVESHMLKSAISSKEHQKSKRKHESNGADWICAIAPFLKAEDLEALIKEKIDEGDTFLIPDDMLPAIAPFISSAFLGQIIRQRAPKPPAKSEPAPPSPDRDRSLAVVLENGSTESKPSNSAEELQRILAKLSGLKGDEKDRVESTLANMLRELGQRLP